MNLTNKQLVMGASIIGFFIASAILTVAVPTEEEETTVENQDIDPNIQAPEVKNPITDSAEKQTSAAPKDTVIVSKALEGDPYEELESLIGLGPVKEEVKSLANFVKIQQARKAQGLKTTSVSYHLVFTGSPGTGKTTVARIMARIYKDLGVLKKGHLVETDRSGLIAEYVGQTAVKTNKVIDSALGGVLFIDEAYALNNGHNDYGSEAIATLLKRMEDDRDSLIVIVAGYTNEMKKFIDTNPGLQSRFNRYLDFPDYSADELFEIYMLRAKKYGFELTDEAAESLKTILDKAVATKDRNFGNARYARNLFEKTITQQANRLAAKGANTATKRDLTVIEKEDIEKAK